MHVHRYTKIQHTFFTQRLTQLQDGGRDTGKLDSSILGETLMVIGLFRASLALAELYLFSFSIFFLGIVDTSPTSKYKIILWRAEINGTL